MILGHTLNEGAMVIITDTKPWALTEESHRSYLAIRAHLVLGEFDEAEALLDVAEHIREFVDERLSIDDGMITFEARAIGNKMSEYMFRMMDEGAGIDPLIAFITNLRENPSKRAVEELYTFMDVNSLPITPDGHFLAFKFVNEDYTDCHTGKIDNSIGEKPWMPRNLVNEDKHETCSDGFHFCSKSYLEGGWGERWMIAKVNPKDVVSIPTDYNNSKGRCNTYEVIAEIDCPHRGERDGGTDGTFESTVDDTFDTSDAAALGRAHGGTDRNTAKSAKKSYAKVRNHRAPDTYPANELILYANGYEDAFGAPERAAGYTGYGGNGGNGDMGRFNNPGDVEVFESDNEYQIAQATRHGMINGKEDRATAQRTKKAYASIRNPRHVNYFDNDTGVEFEAYMEAYDKAFRGE